MVRTSGQRLHLLSNYLNSYTVLNTSENYIDYSYSVLKKVKVWSSWVLATINTRTQ